MDNIALLSAEPVLPSFGCVYIMGILLNIDNIQTAEQAIETVVK